MQISSPLLTPFSLNKYTTYKRRGFTLIELLISVAIIGVLTALVTVKYKAFDSTTLLKGAAYEIALTIREAQVKSISAVRSTAGFDYPRGVSVTPAPGSTPTTASKTYLAFQFRDSSLPPYNDIADSDPDVATILGTSTLDRSIYVSDVCVNPGNDCTPSGIDISFRRPEFKALFHGRNSSGVNFTPAQDEAISDVTIKVTSSNNTANVFLVTVSQLGQITVSKQP